MRSSLSRRLLPLFVLVATAGASCTSGSASEPKVATTESLIATSRARLDSAAATDSQVATISFATRPRGRTLGQPRREWGAIEDTMVRFSVFAPATQTTYLAAVRAKRVLVDIGRVDLIMKDKPERLAALKRVAAQLSPIAPGARFRLRHIGGTEDAVVSGYDVWNGRLVATLTVSPRLDSLAQAVPSLVASAELLEGAPASAATAPDVRGDTAATDSLAAVQPCLRDSVPSALLARADSVSDSLLVAMAMKPIRIPRLAREARSYTARVPGCFGAGRLLVTASIRAGAYEYLVERMVLLDTLGRVTPLAVRDYRFRVHDDLRAVDVDGDGVDDVAALGSGRGVGGTTVLRLDSKSRLLERAASGFGFDRQ